MKVSTDTRLVSQAAYGETVGGTLGAAVRPLMLRPDQGAISILWAGTAPDARSNDQYKNGMCESVAGSAKPCDPHLGR